MLITKNTLHKILILGVATFLITCGGGGGGSVPEPQAELVEGTITGIATLAPIDKAEVTVFDFSTGQKGPVITTALNPTDATGAYIIPLKSSSKPILVCIKGGSYNETASVAVSKKNVAFGISDELCAVTNYQTGQPHKIAITFYTHLAYALTLNNIANSISTQTSITNANSDISDWVGVDIIKILPADVGDPLSATGGLSDQNKYGFANAGISSLIAGISIKGGGIVFGNANSKILAQRAFDDVVVDGLLNGRTGKAGIEGAQLIGSETIIKDIYKIDLAASITGFSNTVQNKSLLNANNSNLTDYVDAFAAYNKSILGVEPPSNKPPIANPDTATVDLGRSVIIDVLKNDSKGNPSDTLTVSIDAQPSSGAVVTVNPGSTTVTYKTAVDAVADTMDTFTYFANDQFVKSTTPATVRINIIKGNNTKPVAKALTITMAAGTTKNILLANLATDAEGNPLTTILDTQPASNANAGGSLAVVKTADNSIDFTAGVTITGEETFTYHVNDGLLDSNIATITVVITAAANRPPVGVPDAVTVQARELSVLIPVLINDTDVDTAAANLKIKPGSLSTPAQGNVTIEGLSINYSPSFTPTLGPVTFTYIVTDGVMDSLPTTVTVTIKNIPPEILFADSGTAYPGNVPIFIKVDAVDPDGPGGFLTINVKQPTNGTVSIVRDPLFIPPLPFGEPVGLNPQAFFEIEYTPPDTKPFGLSGRVDDSFEVTVSDGFDVSAPTLVNVTLIVDRPPVANDDVINQFVRVGGPEIRFSVLGNDKDDITQFLRVFDYEQPSVGFIWKNGGESFLYTPPKIGQAQTVTFRYRATDGRLPSNFATVTITLSENQSPVAIDDSYTISVGTATTLPVLFNDTDPENDKLTLGSMTNSAPSGEILRNSLNNAFIFTPSQIGNYSINYFAKDENSSSASSALVTITVQ